LDRQLPRPAQGLPPEKQALMDPGLLRAAHAYERERPIEPPPMAGMV